MCLEEETGGFVGSFVLVVLLWWSLVVLNREVLF